MAVKWRFVMFERAGGAVPFKEWHDGAPTEAKAELELVVRYLRFRDEWTDKDGAKDLSGKHAPLTELMIDFDARSPGDPKSRKRRFRPIGYKDSSANVFVLFGGCEKSGGKLDPEDTFDAAMRAFDEWQRGLGEVHEFEI